MMLGHVKELFKQNEPGDYFRFSRKDSIKANLN